MVRLWLVVARFIPIFTWERTTGTGEGTRVHRRTMPDLWRQKKK